MSIRITHLRVYPSQCIACFHVPHADMEFVSDECHKHGWEVSLTPIGGVPAVEATIKGITEGDFHLAFDRDEFFIDPYPRQLQSS